MIFQGIFVWENDKDPLHAQPGEQHEIVQGEGLWPEGPLQEHPRGRHGAPQHAAQASSGPEHFSNIF